MANKNNDGTAPSASVVKDCVKQIDRLVGQIGHGKAPLTASEKQRLLKIRKGGRDVVRSLATLATKYDVEGAPLSVITDNVDYAESLDSLVQQSKLLSALTSDLMLQAQSAAWKAGMQTYAALSGRAAIDPRVAHDLEPVSKALAMPRARKRRSTTDSPNAPPPETTETPKSP